MAIETFWLEGFEAYDDRLESPSDWHDNYTYYTSTELALTGGRDGKHCARFTHTATSDGWFARSVGKNCRMVIVGFAYKLNAGVSSVSYQDDGIVALMPHAGAPHISLLLNTDLTISVVRGAAETGTVLSTSTNTIVDGTWHYIEFKAFIDNTTGAYELKVDGTSWTSGTSADTQDDATNTISLVKFSRVYTGTGGEELIDDVYVRGDETTNTAGGFWGDVSIQTVFPNANGANRDFTLSTGTDDFAVLDETGDTPFTDYAYSGTATDQITCGFGAMTGSGTILAAAACAVTRPNSGGNRNVKPICVSGVTTDVGTSVRPPAGATNVTVYETDPNTASAWTETNLNAAEFGIEIV